LSFLHSPDPDYDIVDIEYMDEDIFTVRKDNSKGGVFIIEIHELD
jgi:hypothetical protein